MGCLESKEVELDEAAIKKAAGFASENDPVYNRKRRATLSIGEHVPLKTSTKARKGPTVIFIFGGPGSRKGMVLDYLMCIHGFKYVNVEEVIREDILKPLAKKDEEAVFYLQKALEFDREADIVNLDNIFEALAKRIERMMNGDRKTKFIVDIVPTLEYMIGKKKMCYEKDPRPALSRFEEESFPVTFAINLAIPDSYEMNLEKLEMSIASSSMRSSKNNPEKKDPTINSTSVVNEENAPKDSKRQSVGAASKRQSVDVSGRRESERKRSVQDTITTKAKTGSGMGDEGSSQRTLKRLRSYKRAAQEFVKAFTETERLITINITSGVDTIISGAISNFICQDYGLKPIRGAFCSLIFISSMEYESKIDVGRYEPEKLSLEGDLAIDEERLSPSSVNKLTDFLDGHPETDLFIVNLEGTCFTDEAQLAHAPGTGNVATFVNNELRTLEQILPGYLKAEQKEVTDFIDPCFTSVTAPENQIFIFHKSDPMMTASFREALTNFIAFHRIKRWKTKAGLQ